jgi:hypothetical protein
MSVSYEESMSEIGLSDLAFNVTTGAPEGGSYSGPGIIGTTFHPGLAGVGTHPVVYSVLNSNGCYSTDTSFITVIDNVGISEIKDEIRIFPNPTSDNIWIKVMQPFNYSLIGNDGKTLSTGNFSDEFTLNLSQLSNGIYFLRLTNESKVYEFKISKID